MYSILSYYYTSLIFFALYLAARRCGKIYAVLMFQECCVSGIHFEAFDTIRPVKYLFHPDNKFCNTVIPRLTKAISSGITFVSLNLR